LPCGTAAELCSLAASAFAQEAITTPILTSDPNFRDLAGIAAQYGGTGYAGALGPTPNSPVGQASSKVTGSKAVLATPACPPATEVLAASPDGCSRP